MKRFLQNNVLEEARERNKFIFDNFERIYLSFSAGKDSTVMLHLAMEEAKKRNRKIGLLIIDLEGQYKLTIDHMRNMIKEYKDNIELFWVCLPIHLRNAVSVYGPFWKCWDNNKKNAWIREKPEEGIGDDNYFPFFHDGMEFEEFVPLFGEWYSQGKLTACMVGIRTQESLNRFRTIASMKKERYQEKGYTTKVTDHVYNAYPIYDWKTEDIWSFHGKYPQYKYNLLYDYMYKAGLPLKHMRICQPYGDDQRKGLWLFHLIEPETWARVVARVAGANGGALYVQEWGNINGYRKVTKPEGHTWESFARLLMDSMPYKTGEHYKNKIWKFIKWWQTRGYPDGIPSEVDYDLEINKLAPSWRRVCKSLLRNDFWCKGMGFSQTKSEAYKKYLSFMKNKRQQETLL
jgi:predicted phosphoadenosine phosphosulfate sulfurtransferase